MRRSWVSLALGAWLVGCGSDKGKGAGFGPDEIAADAGAQEPVIDASSPTFGGGGTDSSSPQTTGETLLYAHNDATLFTVDPKDPNLAVKLVGPFACMQGTRQDDGMTDIAVDRTGKLYGVAPQAVYLDMKVAGNTVNCGKRVALTLSKDTRFYGATFAPRGTLSADKETLIVSNTEGELYQVNTESGAIALIGTFGRVPKNDGRGHSYPATHQGELWSLSGDIVFLENKGSPIGFATVRDCDEQHRCGDIDSLLLIEVSKLSATSPTEVGVLRGQIVREAKCPDSGNTGYGRIFGVGAYGGDIIGFSRGTGVGEPQAFALKINNDNAEGCLLAIHTKDVPGGFWGAGVTTVAPVIAPPR